MSKKDKPPLPPGWEMKKLGDICDITGPETLKLHPTEGINPFMTACTRCGKDIGVALVGIHDYKDTCPKCNAVHYGGAKRFSGAHVQCQKCDHPFDTKHYRKKLEKNEKLPGGWCDDCKKMQEACDKAVEEGGVYFKCKKCGTEGAMIATSEIAQLVREKTKTPTGPIGINLEECPQCPEETSITSQPQTKDEQ